MKKYLIITIKKFVSIIVSLALVLSLLSLPITEEKAHGATSHYIYTIGSTFYENDTLYADCPYENCPEHATSNKRHVVFAMSYFCYTDGDIINYSYYEHGPLFQRIEYDTVDLNEFLKSTGLRDETPVINVYREENGEKGERVADGSVFREGNYLLELIINPELTLTTTIIVFPPTVSKANYELTRTGKDTYVLNFTKEYRNQVAYILTYNNPAASSLADKRNLLKTHYMDAFNYTCARSGSPFSPSLENGYLALRHITQGEEFKLNDVNEKYGIFIGFNIDVLLPRYSIFRSVGFNFLPRVGQTVGNELNDYLHSHEMIVTPSTDGESLLAYCNKEDEYHCSAKGIENALTLTLSGNSFFYTGANTKWFDFDSEEKFRWDVQYELDPVTISYYMDEECLIPTNTSEEYGEALNEGEAPKNPGTYYVKASYINSNIVGAEEKSITKKFEITKLPMTVLTAPKTIGDNNIINNNDENDMIVGGVVDGGSFVYKVDEYEWGNIGQIPKASDYEPGIHKVYYKIIPDRDHQELDYEGYLIVDVENYGASIVASIDISSENTEGEASIIRINNLGEAVKKEILPGQNVLIEVSGKPVPKSEVSNSIKESQNKSYDELMNGSSPHEEFIDIEVLLQYEGQAKHPLTNFDTPLEMEITYPLAGTDKKLVIYRYHDNKKLVFTELTKKPTDNYIDGTMYIDRDNNKIYLYSQYFSTYSITYLTDTHTVSFVSNAGVNIPSILVKGSDTLKKLPVPSQDGFDFSGWFTDKLLQDPFDLATMITKDITLYAKWSFNAPLIAVDNAYFKRPDKMTLTEKGEQLKLEAVILPSNATFKSLNYRSSNESVVTVDNKGLVTAVGEGSAIITAVSSSGKKTSIELVVKFKQQNISSKKEHRSIKIPRFNCLF